MLVEQQLPRNEWVDMDTFDEFLMDFADDVSISTNENSQRNTQSSGEHVPIAAGDADGILRELGLLNDNALPRTKAPKGTKQKVVKSSRDTKIVSKSQKNSKASSLKHETGSDCSDSRKPPQSSEMRLVVFPVFEKCDSLMHFPHIMTQHLNTGDHDSLARLMHSYVDKSCQVYFCSPDRSAWSYQRLLQLFMFTGDLHPDTLICVHAAKVVEHEISATLYFKFTDNPIIRDSVLLSTSDPEFARMALPRDERLKQIFRLEERTEDEREEINALVGTEQDMVVYGKLNLKVQIDSRTKKIVRLRFDSELTSLRRCASIRGNTFCPPWSDQ